MRVIVKGRIRVSRNRGDPCASSGIPYGGHGRQRRLGGLDSGFGPGNARQYQTKDAGQGGTTLGGKRLSERTMAHAKPETLIDYCMADMQRRGRTDDPVGTNRRALRRFGGSVNPESTRVTHLEVSVEVVDGYVSAMQQGNGKVGAPAEGADQPGRGAPVHQPAAFAVAQNQRERRGMAGGVGCQPERQRLSCGLA